jgi:hypothetical protein
VRCASCGFAVEEDGHGLAPRRIRSELLRGGTWSVQLNADQPMVKLARALARLLDWPATDLLRFLRLTDTLECIGTHSEANWLAAELREVGVHAVVQRASRPAVDVLSRLLNSP